MGSMAMQLRPFTVADPMEMYGRAMTLRAMMDQQRARELQQQALELKVQQEQQEQEQLRRLSDLYRTNPNPTVRDVMSAAPGSLGLRSVTEHRQAQTAEAGRKKSELELQDKVRKLLTNRAKAIVLDPDPASRQKRTQESIAEYLEAGLVPPELANQTFDDNMLLQFIAQSEGPEAVDKILQSRAEEERKAAQAKRQEAEHQQTTTQKAIEIADKQLDFGVKMAPFIKDPATYAEWRSELPPNIRKRIPEAYSPSAVQIVQNLGGKPTAEQQNFGAFLENYLAAHNLQPNAANWLKAYDAFNELQRQRIGVPGVDVLKPQAVVDQEVETARKKAEDAAKIAATKPQNAAAVKDKELALKNLEDTLQAYKTELERVGPTFQPEKGAKLNTLYTNLMMGVKTLFELGVITGPDMQIIQGAISDPSGMRGNWLGTSALLEQLGVMKSMIERGRTNLREVYGAAGSPADTTQVPNPIVGPAKGDKKRKVWNPQTGQFEEK